MTIELYDQIIGKVFLVPEAIGVIPQGCRIYCFAETEEYIRCFTSMDICGTRYLNLHRDQIRKLVLLN